MQPLSFHPILKRIRWGGRRLGTELGKPLGPETDYAESWEICDHGSDQSRVAFGPFAEQTLQALLHQHRTEMLGPASTAQQFPLLIKYLDCHDRLSVQVHPDDTLAREFQPEENGKTEAWVVMATEPGSLIYAGFRPGVTETDLRAALANGTVEQLLHRITPLPGECYFIPAGTVHALGEGVLIAEVQQSSDLTFRLYDWGRLDAAGQSRPLHIEESIRCLNFSAGPVQATQPEVLGQSSALTIVKLCECPYFRLFRWQVRERAAVPDSDHCRVVLGLEGSGRIHTSEQTWPFSRGNTLLFPAACPPAELIPTTSAPWTLLVAEIP